MKHSFTFVHAADLHLDSPFKGIAALDASVVDGLRSATFDAYHSLIDLCVERQAAFLLIAGDVYDGEDRSLRAQLRFRDGLTRLSERNIGAFVVHGNHDHSGSEASAIHWPDNVHIFGHLKVESKVVSINGEPAAVVSGISHARKNESQNLAGRFEPSAVQLFRIGLLHCNVGSNTGYEPYAPCELSDLLDARVDYWALGHVHERRSLSQAPYVNYSGNTQGRHFREKGERGCFAVTVEDGKVAGVEFCPLDSVRWLETSIRIESLATIDELDRLITASVEHLVDENSGRAVICRVNIEGRGRLYPDLRKSGNASDLLDRVRERFRGEDPFVWIDELAVNCRPETDIEVRKKAGDFLAQVLSVSAEIAQLPDGVGELARVALADLAGHRQFEKSVGGFSDSEISSMMTEAELICLDKLEAAE